MLSVATIKKEAGEYDLEVAQRLKVQRHGLTHIANLDACGKLVELRYMHALNGAICTRFNK
jgi:hypothetical protein